MRLTVARSWLSGVAALCILAIASGARAEVAWRVSGVVGHGSTLGVAVGADVRADLDADDPTADADGVFATYRDDLRPAVAGDPAPPDPLDPLATGGATFAGSFARRDALASPGPDTPRDLAGGLAQTVPEPSTWVMMIVGLLMVGAGLRANLRAARELEALREDA